MALKRSPRCLIIAIDLSMQSGYICPMKPETDLEIFLVCAPGFEQVLRAETIEKGFKKPKASHGGVTIWGGWSVAWRANLDLRGASKVLVRLGSFKVTHLSQLEKRASELPWSELLNDQVSVRLEASCTKSKIYHQKAAAERIGRAITRAAGCRLDDEGDITIKARLFEDRCTISIDISGDGLHKRGHKEALNKAPLRETLAALILRQCGYDGTEPVLDPMCGSGTFVLEAADIATCQKPGRSRSFAFEKLMNFDPELWEKMKSKDTRISPAAHFYGFDRDKGAIERSQANAQRADLGDQCTFTHAPIGTLKRPDGPAGLVIINPPYGVRLGDVKKLSALYKSLGTVLMREFSGWRVGIVTNTDKLAKATGLPFVENPMRFDHGGIKVSLYQTDPLA